MKLIAGKNDTGKTRELIKYSLDNNIPILALHHRKAEALRAKAISYFDKPVSVITLDTLTAYGYNGEILVDDLDKAFTELLTNFAKSSMVSLSGATITED